MNTLVHLLAEGDLKRADAMGSKTERDRAKRSAKQRARRVVNAHGQTPPQRLECLVRLLLVTGMRAHEALSLKWTDIDEKSSCARFQDAHGVGPSYTIPPGLMEALGALRCPFGSRPLLGLNTWAVTRHWKVISARAGMPELRLADLTFEGLYRAGVNRQR